MGLRDFLFGGVKRYDPTNPAVGPIARDLADYGREIGLGTAGKYAKQWINRYLKTGNFGETPEVAYTQSRGAANWADLKRQVEMGSASASGGQVPQNALLAKYLLQNQDQTGQNAMGAVANATQNYLAAFQNAKNSERSAKISALTGAGGLYSPIQQYKTGGFLGALGQIAGAVAPIAGAVAGIPGLGAARGGGTSIRAQAPDPGLYRPVSGSIDLGGPAMNDQYKSGLASKLRQVRY